MKYKLQQAILLTALIISLSSIYTYATPLVKKSEWIPKDQIEALHFDSFVTHENFALPCLMVTDKTNSIFEDNNSPSQQPTFVLGKLKYYKKTRKYTCKLTDKIKSKTYIPLHSLPTSTREAERQTTDEIGLSGEAEIPKQSTQEGMPLHLFVLATSHNAMSSSGLLKRDETKELINRTFKEFFQNTSPWQALTESKTTVHWEGKEIPNSTHNVAEMVSYPETLSIPTKLPGALRLDPEIHLTDPSTGHIHKVPTKSILYLTKRGYQLHRVSGWPVDPYNKEERSEVHLRHNFACRNILWDRTKTRYILEIEALLKAHEKGHSIFAYDERAFMTGTTLNKGDHATNKNTAYFLGNSPEPIEWNSFGANDRLKLPNSEHERHGWSNPIIPSDSDNDLSDDGEESSQQPEQCNIM